MAATVDSSSCSLAMVESSDARVVLADASMSAKLLKLWSSTASAFDEVTPACSACACTSMQLCESPTETELTQIKEGNRRKEK